MPTVVIICIQFGSGKHLMVVLQVNIQMLTFLTGVLSTLADHIGGKLVLQLARSQEL